MQMLLAHSRVLVIEYHKTWNKFCAEAWKSIKQTGRKCLWIDFVEWIFFDFFFCLFCTRYTTWIFNKNISQLILVINVKSTIPSMVCNSIKFLYCCCCYHLVGLMRNILFQSPLAYQIMFIYNQWYEFFLVINAKSCLISHLCILL